MEEYTLGSKAKQGFVKQNRRVGRRFTPDFDDLRYTFVVQ